MKRSDLSKIVGAGVLSLSMVVLPAYAQTSTTPDTTNTAPGTTTTAPGTTTGTTQTQGTDYRATENRGFDWGWLGLIGLAGLAGLARKREEPTRYRDPDTVASTTYRE